MAENKSNTKTAVKKKGEETGLATRSPKETFIKFLRKMRPQFASVLPSNFPVEKFERMALTAASRNKELFNCDPYSVADALMQCAEMGLEPNDARGQAFLVPFWNSKKGMKEAVLIAGYRGLIDLAYRSGKVQQIKANIVYENEPFEYRETGEKTVFSHTPLPVEHRGERKVAFYAFAVVNGLRHFEVMWPDEVNARRERSKAKDAGPWVTDTDSMEKKTVTRSLVKWLPSSPEDPLQKMSMLDELSEVEDATQRTITFEGELIEDEISEEVKAKTDSKKEKLKEKISSSKASNGKAKRNKEEPKKEERKVTDEEPPYKPLNPKEMTESDDDWPMPDDEIL